MGYARRILVLAGLAAALGAPRLGHATVGVITVDKIQKSEDSQVDVPSKLWTEVAFDAEEPSIPHLLNIKDCKAIANASVARLEFTFSRKNIVGALTSNEFAVKVAPPDKSCDTASLASTSGDTTGGCVLAQPQKTSKMSILGEIVNIDLYAMLGFAGNPGLCQANTVKEARIYFILAAAQGVGTTGGTTSFGALSISLDLAPPATPTIAAVSAGNKNLQVSWKQVDTSGDISSRVYWSTSKLDRANLTDSIAHADVGVGTTSHQIKNLNNDTTYYVTVVAIDASGNESEGSVTMTGRPFETQDMWAYYKANGGAEEGGFAPCSAAPTGRMASGIGGLLLFAGLAIWLTRRRKRLHGLPILVLALGAVVPARSEAVSPQTSSMEFRAGYYEPNIDREFETTNKAKPFADIMTDGDWQMGGSVDWRIWHGFGEFAMGLGADRWKHDGRSRTLGGTATSDSTTLQIVPITVDLVYRFDVLAERWDFPLVPYAKIGGAYALWWMQDGVGNLSHYVKDGKTFTAQGGTGGFQGVLGMRLLLDVFEPQAARSFDIEMGVNHSYIFAEYRSLVLTDFGNPKSIDLSADIFSAGIAFDL